MSTIELAVGRLKTAPEAAQREALAAAADRWTELQQRLKAKEARKAPDLRLMANPQPVPALRQPATVSDALRMAGLAVASALGGAALMYVALAGHSGASRPAVQAATPAPVVVVPATAPVTTARVAGTAPALPANQRAPAPAPAAGAESEARELIARWAAAWSARDANRYLGFYAPDFMPDKGVALATWEATRRKRLQAPRSIKVEVRDLRIETAGDNRLIARFTQDYAADAYRESGTPKLLLLTRQGGTWKIATEL